MNEETKSKILKIEGRGFYCGHKCGGRASWQPKFKVKFTPDKEKATRFTSQQVLNLSTNLSLMGVTSLIGGAEILDV